MGTKYKSKQDQDMVAIIYLTVGLLILFAATISVCFTGN